MPGTSREPRSRRRGDDLGGRARRARSCGVSVISMRPLLSVALAPSTPMNDERPVTSGSSRMTCAGGLLALGHRRERHRLRRLGDRLDRAGVLHREEPLRHRDVEHTRSAPASATATNSVSVWWPSTHVQLPPVAARSMPSMNRAASCGRTGPAAPACAVPQQPRAHHRRERQRHHERDQDRHRQRDRELAEQPADHVGHEQQRDQHRDQRDRQRDQREADLPARPRSAASIGVSPSSM